MISEWPLFEFSGWTLEHVQAALDALGRGQLRYPEQLLLALDKDPSFQHGRRIRTRTAASTPHCLTFPEGFPEAQRRDLVQHLPDLWGATEIDEHGAMSAHARGASTKYRLSLGVGPCGVQWRLSPSGATWLPVLRARSAGWLSFDPNLSRYDFTGKDDDGSSLEPEPVIPDGRRWLLFREQGSNFPHQEGLLRCLAIIVWFKQATLRYWHQYNSVHGNPQRKLKVPGKQREGEDVRKLAAQVRALLGGQVILLPQYPDGTSFDLSLLEAMAATWETFPAFCTYVDKWVTLCWTGAYDNTQGGDAGSKARAEVHERVSARDMASDCDSDALTLRILWRAFCYYNRLALELAPVSEFHYETESPTEKAQRRKVDAEAMVFELANARVLELAGVAVDYAAIPAGRMPLLKGAPPARPKLDERDAPKLATAPGAPALPPPE